MLTSFTALSSRSKLGQEQKKQQAAATVQCDDTARFVTLAP